MPTPQLPNGIVDYLSIVPSKPFDDSTKQLYEKCMKLAKSFQEQHRIIIITPKADQFINQSTGEVIDKMSEFGQYLHGPDCEGIDIMRITASSKATDEQAFQSVLTVQRSLKERGSRPPEATVFSIPEDIEHILMKTRLGDNNGV